MSGPERADDRLRTLVAAPLRIGTVVAVALVGIGLAMSLAGGGRAGEPTPMLETLAGGGAPAVISAGLLLLALVPLGVAIGTVIGFWRAGERRYLVGSAVVTVLLVASLLVSLLLLPPST